MSEILLQIQDLSVEFSGYRGIAKVLDRVSLSLRAGEIFGVVGETGCGKSVMAKSVLRLIPEPPGRITSGRILLRGEDILQADNRRLRTIRGNLVSMIFQEPMSSLNPVFTVGNQMREVLQLHRPLDRHAAETTCIDLLRRVQLPDAASILAKYPHELSGGMRQRVMIAMALSCDPDLLIADEPTTALDVTVQGQVLAILTRLTKEQGVTVLFITHDMGVVAQTCNRVAVMYAGHVVEVAEVTSLFAAPRHPYTKGLMACIPTIDEDRETLASIAGTVPELIAPPPGCRFIARCPHAKAVCNERPGLFSVGPDHFVACHLYRSDRRQEEST
ncbi:ABC transporter ATP-binding protein [Desulfofustis glycolicus]|uniref:Peptide/nickel transport system ATP-binding protein n=1 Tax=Desulfofustis glycolicus DSM 9705 TaxID=1121409 RepID=A0A1M5YG98_9BACT|nr:ABC transporter ATP-binding protein [Desulfofustis glycolicus]SHI10929.1 peptide/nickel transport system ATP-binding protein [Desulfofustis glycolicus DSM 9705]